MNLPVWHEPSGAKTGLRVYNSLTRTKVDFVPVHRDYVSWYICGPTVYDAAHMGHARSYITFDILRRILQGYFKFNVRYVMNITDVDDKIILRARQNFLFEKFLHEHPMLDSALLEILMDIWKEAVSSTLGQPISDIAGVHAAYKMKKLAMQSSGMSTAESEGKLELFHATMDRILTRLDSVRQSLDESSKTPSTALLRECQDLIAPWVDKQFGATITDQTIFRELASYWEDHFLKDMNALNVTPADTITRVSEYVPKIVDYTQQIIDRGYAYVTNGSVYFDTAAFVHGGRHVYAKLEPSSASNTQLTNEGEGAISVDLGAKKAACDFALWKKSKPGEPFWSSPWSQGRPGWHIECSVMASDVLGNTLDIHSGGIDLRFPHHDNEVAQCEAYFDSQQWVNYFFHAGHLHIEGQKMSKSLKNFITIQNALSKYSARQIRLLFLLHAWGDVLDYKETSMDEAIAAERRLWDFFSAVLAVLREPHIISKEVDLLPYKIQGSLPVNPRSWGHIDNSQARSESLCLQDVEGSMAWCDVGELVPMKPEDIALKNIYCGSRTSIHSALCDSFDTVTVMHVLFDLARATKTYINAPPVDSRAHVPNVFLLIAIARYVTHVLRIFGVVEDTSSASIGFPEMVQPEISLRPLLNVVGSFRDRIRTLARSQDSKDAIKNILSLCDQLRDDELLRLGIEVEDREGHPFALMKVGQRDLLLRRLEDRLRMDQERERLRAETLRKKAERAERARIPPETMFRTMDCYHGLFMNYDERGIPTHDQLGEPLSKSRLKKLVAEYEVQTKLHRDFVKQADVPLSDSMNALQLVDSDK